MLSSLVQKKERMLGRELSYLYSCREVELMPCTLSFIFFKFLRTQFHLSSSMPCAIVHGTSHHALLQDLIFLSCESVRLTPWCAHWSILWPLDFDAMERRSSWKMFVRLTFARSCVGNWARSCWARWSDRIELECVRFHCICLTESRKDTSSL